MQWNSTFSKVIELDFYIKALRFKTESSQSQDMVSLITQSYLFFHIKLHLSNHPLHLSKPTHLINTLTQ